MACDSIVQRPPETIGDNAALSHVMTVGVGRWILAAIASGALDVVSARRQDLHGPSLPGHQPHGQCTPKYEDADHDPDRNAPEPRAALLGQLAVVPTS